MPIILLDGKTINRIAAGEVIERPASVVKELVENSIDAKSTRIEIKIESGGRNFIAITDNGMGIEKDEIELAFLRHATSKLSSDDDLIEIRHLGFRGEALPSIAAVSRIRLSSKAKGVEEAWSVYYEGGEKREELAPCRLLTGTEIEVRDLFFATPNRLKFLKSERAETQHIVDIINNLAMINYDIGFTLKSGSKKLLEYESQNRLFSRLCEIEKEFQENALEVCEQEEGTKLTGYICKATVNRGKSDMIYTFINKRPVKDNLLVGAVRYAYHDLIPNGRYPIVALHLEVPFDEVDVNVHPNKSEVRFQNKRMMYELVRRGLVKALSTRVGEETRVFEGKSFDPFNELISDAKNLPSEKERIGNRNNNIENKREFYEKRPSSFENQLMSEFIAPEKYSSIKEPEEKRQIEETRILEQITKEEQIECLEDYPLGFARCQVYGTYIISQTKNNLIIVDQHAAHERLIYENLKKRSEIKKQQLLLPEVIEIKNQAGMEMIENYKDKLNEMGFDLEITSEFTLSVKSIPAILGNINVKEMIIDVSERLLEMEDTLPIEDKINKILATIACHGSIRGGRDMRLEEMNELLRQMEKISYSGQCNHGRPTYVELKLSDIEKWFERK